MDTVSSAGRVIPNFAAQHLKAATIFRDHTIQLESQHATVPLGEFFGDIRSYASGCIMSATASLEALINELFIAPNGGLRPKLSNFDDAFWSRRGIERKSILEKYQFALDMLKKPKFVADDSSYLNAKALIDLRNALVHYKAPWDLERQQTSELKEMLKGKYETSPFVLDEGADFATMKSMSAGAARWVIATVVDFVAAFDARTKLDDKKMQAFLRIGRDPLGK
jgi:hypothetical protein